MKKLHELALSLAVVLVVGAVGMSVGERLAVAFAEEGEREGEVARKPAKENPEQREGREKQEREAVGKIISDEAFRLLREAKELEDHGKPDAAAELRQKAKRVEAEAREKREWKEPRERKEELVSDEAFRLFEEAKRLEDHGKPDAAAELRTKAKRIEGEYKLRTAVDKLKSHLRIRPEKGTRLIAVRPESHDEKEARLAGDMVARGQKEWKEPREGKEELVSDEAFRLFEEAKRLEAEGKREDAAELRQKAKRVEAEAREKREWKEPRERKEELVSDEAFRLLREAKELEAQERPDEAEKLRAKAKAIEAKAREKKQAREGREGERVVRVEVLERLHGDLFASQRELEELASEYGPKHPRMVAVEKKVRMIMEQIRAAEVGKLKTEKAPEREGRVGPDEVRGLLEKAERIEAEARREAQELRQRAERIEAEPREKREGELKTEAAERIEAVIREHLEVAERLKAEGKGDAAEEHVRKAESLRQELVVRLERRPEAPPGEGERFVREKREPEEPRLRREGPAPEFVREPRPVRPEEPRPEREPFVRQPMPGPAFIAPQIAELRREVNQLREELAHIRELLQEVLERRAPAPSR